VGDVEILYPPCDTTPDADLTKSRQNLIISVAQFRPEKNHTMLIEAFSDFLQKLDQPDYKLVMIGGCRNEGDENRMNDLKKLTVKLNISEKVVFKPNLPFPELQESKNKRKSECTR
jgi:alpha-1,2-mannosyltransferase